MEPRYLAGIERVVRLDDGEFAFGDGLLQDFAIRGELGGNIVNVILYGEVGFVGSVHRVGLFAGIGNGFDDGLEVGGFSFSAGTGGGDGATALMSHDNHDRTAEMLDGVFDAADRERIGGFAGGANDKKIAEAFIKYKLRRNTAIGTTEHDDMRRLCLGEFLTASDKIARLSLSVHEASITSGKFFPDLVSGRCRGGRVLCEHRERERES